MQIIQPCEGFITKSLSTSKTLNNAVNAHSYKHSSYFQLFASKSIESATKSDDLLTATNTNPWFGKLLEKLNINKNDGQNKDLKISKLKEVLFESTNECQPNGLKATKAQQKEIDIIVQSIEALNPTLNPANSLLMNGYWRMIYTDFNPPATSSGTVLYCSIFTLRNNALFS